ncbi:MAG: hypothetical protein IIA01_03830 [Proteobacteria bacterium]|nr:hypothetical protein [Pseudomonadota bacterium]
MIDTSKLVIGSLITLLCLYSIEVSARNITVKREDFREIWPFDAAGGYLYCKNIGGGRKAVWLNTGDGTYALNGQAMSWSQGADLIGTDGGPWKIGRDHSKNFTGLHELIQAGLELCD